MLTKRDIEKLARELAKLTDDGMHKVEDGKRGLFLQITKSTSKREDKRNAISRSWIYRFTITKNGKSPTRDMGLGPFHSVSLAEAIEKADKARKLHYDGFDPIEHKRDAERERAKSKTFKQVAEEYIAQHRHKWTNPKHAAQFQ